MTRKERKRRDSIGRSRLTHSLRIIPIVTRATLHLHSHFCGSNPFSFSLSPHCSIFVCVCVWSFVASTTFWRIRFVLCYKRTTRAHRAHTATSAATLTGSDAYPLCTQNSPFEKTKRAAGCQPVSRAGICDHEVYFTRSIHTPSDWHWRRSVP